MARVLAIVISFSFAVLGSPHCFAPDADVIYHNGSILTMAGDTPSYAEALAVKGGKNCLCR